MGFPRKRAYSLIFKENDPITDGLVVKTAAPTLLDTLDSRVKQREDESDKAYFDRQYGPLVEAILEWNIEDEEGQTLPVTLDGWYTIDLPVQLRIYKAWSNLEEVVDESSPLDSGSGQGSTSGSTTGRNPDIEASIPSQPLA
jgi:hypothetical protein